MHLNNAVTTQNLNPTNAAITLKLASRPPRLQLGFKGLAVFEAFERQLWTFGVFFVELPSPLPPGSPLALVLTAAPDFASAPLPVEVAYLTEQGTAIRVDLALAGLRDALRELKEALQARPEPGQGLDLTRLVREAQRRSTPEQPTPAPTPQPAQPAPPAQPTPPAQPASPPRDETSSDRARAYWLGGRSPSRSAVEARKSSPERAHTPPDAHATPRPVEPAALSTPVGASSPARSVPVGATPSAQGSALSTPVGATAPLQSPARSAPIGASSPARNATRSAPVGATAPLQSPARSAPVGATTNAAPSVNNPSPTHNPAPSHAAAPPAIHPSTPQPSAAPRNAPERAQALARLLDQLDAERAPIGPNGPATALLDRAARCEDAVVSLTSPTGKRFLIMLRLGAPQDVQLLPSPEGSSLERLLHEAGKLTEAQLTQVRDRVARDQETTEQALIACRLIGHEGLGQAMKARITHLLLQAMSLRGGTLTYAPAPSLPYRVSVGPVSLARIAARSVSEQIARLPLEDLEARFASHRRDVLHRVAPPPVLIEELHLTDRQRELLLNQIDGARAVWEILKDSRMGSRATYEALTLFLRLDLVRFGGPAARRPTAQTGEERLAGLRERRRRLDPITDPFELLGLHWSAYDEQLEETWRQLLHDLRPEAWPDDLRDEATPLLNALRDNYTRAYDKLRTVTLRDAWRRKHVNRDQREGALDLYRKQAEMFLYRRDPSQARDACRRALELQPTDRQAHTLMRRIERLEAEERGG